MLIERIFCCYSCDKFLELRVENNFSNIFIPVCNIRFSLVLLKIIIYCIYLLNWYEYVKV